MDRWMGRWMDGRMDEIMGIGRQTDNKATA